MLDRLAERIFQLLRVRISFGLAGGTVVSRAATISYLPSRHSGFEQVYCKRALDPRRTSLHSDDCWDVLAQWYDCFSVFLKLCRGRTVPSRLDLYSPTPVPLLFRCSHYCELLSQLVRDSEPPLFWSALYVYPSPVAIDAVCAVSANAQQTETRLMPPLLPLSLRERPKHISCLPTTLSILSLRYHPALTAVLLFPSSLKTPPSQRHCRWPAYIAISAMSSQAILPGANGRARGYATQAPGFIRFNVYLQRDLCPGYPGSAPAARSIWSRKWAGDRTTASRRWKSYSCFQRYGCVWESPELRLTTAEETLPDAAIALETWIANAPEGILQCLPLSRWTHGVYGGLDRSTWACWVGRGKRWRIRFGVSRSSSDGGSDTPLAAVRFGGFLGGQICLDMGGRYSM